MIGLIAALALCVDVGLFSDGGKSEVWPTFPVAVLQVAIDHDLPPDLSRPAQTLLKDVLVGDLHSDHHDVFARFNGCEEWLSKSHLTADQIAVGAKIDVHDRIVRWNWISKFGTLFSRAYRHDISTAQGGRSPFIDHLELKLMSNLAVVRGPRNDSRLIGKDQPSPLEFERINAGGGGLYRSLHRLSGQVKAVEQTSDTRSGEQGLPLGPLRAFGRFVGGLPLGAKDRNFGYPALPAWVLIARGADRFDDFGRGRRRRLLGLVYAGLGFGALALWACLCAAWWA